MKMPMVPEGWKFLLPTAVAALTLILWGMRSNRIGPWVAGGILLVSAVLLANFFRDPERDPGRPLVEGEVLCPADGIVVACEEVHEAMHLKGRAFHVAIFMDVFDCHVQRMPLDGRIVKRVYHPGRFLAAFAPKASLENEQSHLLVELRGKKRRRMLIKQIAGLLARRVVTDVSEGQPVTRGQRFGRILLGSRVDVFLPPGFRPAVARGDRVWAGETVLGVSR
jgi:phosphatidylserine decarboxylase